MNMNEDLAFMAQLLDKIKWELFDLQHINVTNNHIIHMNQLKRDLIELSSKIHRRYDFIKEDFDLLLPEPTTKTNELPLRTNDSGDYLIRMRKFDGREGEDQKVDHFH